jgi:hypothetical protein
MFGLVGDGRGSGIVAQSSSGRVNPAGQAAQPGVPGCAGERSTGENNAGQRPASARPPIGCSAVGWDGAAFGSTRLGRWAAGAALGPAGLGVAVALALGVVGAGQGTVRGVPSPAGEPGRDRGRRAACHGIRGELLGEQGPALVASGAFGVGDPAGLASLAVVGLAYAAGRGRVGVQPEHANIGAHSGVVGDADGLAVTARTLRDGAVLAAFVAVGLGQLRSGRGGGFVPQLKL